jgi:hypothetical protein
MKIVSKFPLDAIDIMGLTKDYAVLILIESLLQRINLMGVHVKTLFMDAEFFNFPTISTLHKIKTIWLSPKTYVYA